MGGNCRGVDFHSTKFRHFKESVILPYAVGPVKDRALRGHFHENGNKHQWYETKKECNQNQYYVENSLHWFSDQLFSRRRMLRFSLLQKVTVFSCNFVVNYSGIELFHNPFSRCQPHLFATFRVVEKMF